MKRTKVQDDFQDGGITIVRSDYHKQRQYIHTDILQCNDISFGARGLWAYLATLPKGYPMSSSTLDEYVAINNNIIEEEVRVLFEELAAFGYLEYALIEEEGVYKEVYKLNEIPFDGEEVDAL